jgi:oligopeptidase B
MSKLRIWTLAAFVAACTGTPHATQTPALERAHPTPPQTEQRPFVVRAPAGDRQDEYYWLRDDTRKNPEVLAHLQAENAYKDAVLARLRPAQRRLYEEIVARMPPEDASVPVFEDGYWYQRRFVPGGEYPVYARRKGSPEAPEQVLLDGNELSKGHEFFRISAYEVSSDGQQLAWAEDTMGRLQHTIRFKNLSTGALYPDVISNADSALAWANDHQTLLYIEKHPETLLGYRVRKHRLGTKVSEDPLVYEEQDLSFYLSVWKSRSERFLNIYSISTLSSEQRVADASDLALAFHVLVPRERDHEYLAEDHGDEWILRTNYQAPNFRITAVPMASVEKRDAWRDLVPEPKAGLVEDFSVFRGFLAFEARSEGLSRVFTQPWQSATPSAVQVPETASTSMLGDNPEPDSDRLRFEYTSLKTPDSVYELDTLSGQTKLLKQAPVLGGFSSDAYATEYVKAPARDGTLVPVSLVYAKDVKRDGTAPLYQTGYGSYGSSSDPEFSSARLSLLDRGVVFALAHIRGGQELGRAWYEQGKLLNKRNTFTDFIDVTDFLVQQGYAAKERVVARGASAGGLLMGAIANMAPQKYRAIVAHVPFVDVVTTMLDESIPLTTNELDEWGNPKLERYYETMLSYSPYDNVRAQDYPALFVTTGLWDSQVQYYEPAKWVARLRAKKTDDNPIILRINMDAGHGGKSGRFIRQEELAEEYAFVLDQLGVPVAIR